MSKPDEVFDLRKAGWAWQEIADYLGTTVRQVKRWYGVIEAKELFG